MSRAGDTDLYLRQPRRPGTWLAWVAAALVLAAALGWSQHAVDSKLERQRKASQPLPKQAAAMARRAPAAPALNEAGRIQMVQQLALINRDWNGLLASLVPADADTRLLSLDIDPVSGAVRISASAATAAQANDYTVLLQQRGRLQEVRLMSLDGQPQQAVFEVSGQWAR
ncbi:hypothetical protein [Pseudoxanthomonas sp. UTMC 1351]|uniref:hypothetical protein n=1 Tax=Pseudoxanthomonas sp. UTMC 1351 TaxID=2695853 RepID=UPI0034CD49EC